MLVNVDTVTGQDGSALIICIPTGVYYSAQSGGTSCMHPSAEGLCVPLMGFDLDDCLCEDGISGPYGHARMQGKAIQIDAILKRETKDYSFTLSLDYSREAELMEGWCPVLLSGCIAGVGGTVTPHEFHEAKGYLCCGNCD